MAQFYYNLVFVTCLLVLFSYRLHALFYDLFACYLQCTSCVFVARAFCLITCCCKLAKFQIASSCGLLVPYHVACGALGILLILFLCLPLSYYRIIFAAFNFSTHVTLISSLPPISSTTSLSSSFAGFSGVSTSAACAPTATAFRLSFSFQPVLEKLSLKIESLKFVDMRDFCQIT